MKKILIFILACLFVFSALPFGGCGSSETVKITFNGNGGIKKGTSLTSVSEDVVLGSSYLTPVFEKQGYAFKGWDKKLSNISKDTQVNAVWQAVSKTKYIINFDLNGGKLVEGALSQELSYGETAILPSASREGYEFVAWNGLYSNVTQDATIRAEWKRKTFTVRFDVNGGTSENAVNGIVEKQVGYGLAAEPPKVTKEGYYLIGWDSDGNGKADANFGKITKDVASPIRAIWGKKNTETSDVKFTVKFVSTIGNYGKLYKAGSERELESQIVRFCENAVKPNVKQQPYPYRFKCWLGDYSSVDCDRTILALWEEISYTIKFDIDGGKIDESQEVNKKAGLTQYTLMDGTPSKIKDVPVPIKQGFTFAGWAGINEDGNTVEIEQVLESENPTSYTYACTFTAIWVIDSENPININITFDLNGGVTAGGKNQVKEVFSLEENIVAPTAMKDGYEFLCWSMDLETVKRHCLATGEYSLTIKAEWCQL